MNRIQNRSEYATYWPAGSARVHAKNAVPISWRRDTFTFVRGQQWRASDARQGVSPYRYVTRVWLRHRASGAIQSRIAHHAINRVDPSEAPVAWRLAQHARNIETFRMAMMLDTVPVVGSGDFNHRRVPSLLGSSFRYDQPPADAGPSHARGMLDWIVRRPHPHLRLTRTRMARLGNSDHKGLFARYDYTPPPVCR